jgi:hypothetical protein
MKKKCYCRLAKKNGKFKIAFQFGADGQKFIILNIPKMRSKLKKLFKNYI